MATTFGRNRCVRIHLCVARATNIDSRLVCAQCHLAWIGMHRSNCYIHNGIRRCEVFTGPQRAQSYPWLLRQSIADGVDSDECVFHRWRWYWQGIGQTTLRWCDHLGIYLRKRHQLLLLSNVWILGASRNISSPWNCDKLYANKNRIKYRTQTHPLAFPHSNIFGFVRTFQKQRMNRKEQQICLLWISIRLGKSK